MKRFLILALFALSSAFAQEEAAPHAIISSFAWEKQAPEDCAPVCPSLSLFLEAKAACFLPLYSRIQRIYSPAMGLYGLELSWREWEHVYAWVSGSALFQKGHSIGGHYDTHVTLVPIGLGLKYLYDFKRVSIYAGLGALYSYIHMHDQSPYVIHSASRWDWGANVKMGALFLLCDPVFLDVFADYSYLKFSFHNGKGIVVRHDVNFSGFSLGGAIGFPF